MSALQTLQKIVPFFIDVDLLFVKKKNIYKPNLMFNISLLLIFCADKHIFKCLLKDVLTRHCQYPHSDLGFLMLEFITVSWFYCISAVLCRPHNQKIFKDIWAR
jgi:hypothetical protein